MAALVGVARLSLLLPESHSLKDKRRVIRSLRERLQAAYTVSVAETGALNKHQAAELLVAYASSDAGHADEVLAKVVSFTEGYHLPVVLLAVETELIYPF